mgnify:FL=1
MSSSKAEVMAEKPWAGSKGRGRKSREYDHGAPDDTALTEFDWPEEEGRLIEEILSRSNMK